VSRKKTSRAPQRKACCMVSEVLEEAGIDRKRLRQVRRQLLEGVILLCQWQLARMEEERGPAEAPPRPRRVTVE
jgi:hypothetical protein